MTNEQRTRRTNAQPRDGRALSNAKVSSSGTTESQSAGPSDQPKQDRSDLAIFFWYLTTLVVAGYLLWAAGKGLSLVPAVWSYGVAFVSFVFGEALRFIPLVREGDFWGAFKIAAAIGVIVVVVTSVTSEYAKQRRPRI